MVFHDDDLSPALARGSLNSDERGNVAFMAALQGRIQATKEEKLAHLTLRFELVPFEFGEKRGYRSNYYGNEFCIITIQRQLFQIYLSFNEMH